MTANYELRGILTSNKVQGPWRQRWGPCDISGGKGDAESKIAAMEAAGIKVSPSPARLGKSVVEVLKN